MKGIKEKGTVMRKQLYPFDCSVDRDGEVNAKGVV